MIYLDQDFDETRKMEHVENLCSANCPCATQIIVCIQLCGRYSKYETCVYMYKCINTCINVSTHESNSKLQLAQHITQKAMTELQEFPLYGSLQ